MKSIRSKLTIITILIVFIPLGLLSSISYWKARNTMLDSIRESVSTQSVTASKQLDLWLTTHKTEIEMLANSPVIASGDKQSIINYLKQEKERLKVYDGMFVSDAEGNWYSTTGGSGTIKDREYYHQIMKTGKAVISNPVNNKSTGKLALVVAAPIKQDGKVTGLIGANLVFAEMQQLVSSAKVGENGSAYMTQNDGTIIVHDDINMVMKENLLNSSIFPEELKNAAQKMVKGEKDIVRYTFEGVEKYAAYITLKEAGWVLIIDASLDDFTKGLKDFGTTSVIVAMIVLGISVFIAVLFSRNMAKPIHEISRVADNISKGDLSHVNLQIKSKDEVGDLARAFKLMVNNLKQLIMEVQDNVMQVAASSEELTAISEQSAKASSQVACIITDVAQGVDLQLSSVANSTSIIEEISGKIQRIAENTSSVSGMAGKTASVAKYGSESVKKAIYQMKSIEKTVVDSASVVTKLGNRSAEIGQIVDTISSIAGQTNLLALNAAIEAARAGEQGRGFAVVADEIRKLAEQSQNAVKQVALLIKDIQADTNEAVSAMIEGTEEAKSGSSLAYSAGEIFGEIEMLVNQLTEHVQEINTVIQEVAGSSQQIVSIMNNIDKVSKDTVEQLESVSAATEEQAASSQEVAASSNALSRLAEKLTSAVSKFKM